MISIHGKMMGLAMVLALGAGCAAGADEEIDMDAMELDEETVDSSSEALEEAERGGYAAQAQAQVGQMGPSKLGLPPTKGELPSKGVPMLGKGSLGPSKGELPSKGGLLPSKGEFPSKGGLPSKGLPTKGGYAQQGTAQIGQAAVGQMAGLSEAQVGQSSQAQIGAQAQIGQVGQLAQIGQTGAISQVGVGQAGLVGQETGQRDGARCFGGGFGGFGGCGFGGFGGGCGLAAVTTSITSFVPTFINPCCGGFGGFGGGIGGFGW
ncbi:hypothetical protein WME94_50460 [Sorangium sp. So ce429]